MSDTFKTRPGWVSDFFDGTVEHNHAGGQCRVETLAEARAAARGALRGHTRGRCPRWVRTALPCPAAIRADRRCPLSWAEDGGSCPGHDRLFFHAEIDCGVCDARPTCTRRIDEHWEATQRRYGAGVPRWFVRTMHHVPLRRSGRDTLHAARREYNAGYRPGDDAHPDLEDRWEPRLRPGKAAYWWW